MRQWVVCSLAVWHFALLVDCKVVDSDDGSKYAFIFGNLVTCKLTLVNRDRCGHLYLT